MALLKANKNQPKAVFEERRNLKNQKKLWLIVGPSGAGKDTQLEAIMQAPCEFAQLQKWISYTSRPPREGEHYFFVSLAQMIDLNRRSFFAECKEVHNHLYGKPIATWQKLPADTILVTDIDRQGADALLSRFGNDVVRIAYLQVDEETCEQRYRGRCTETGDVFDQGVLNARIFSLREESAWAVIRKEDLPRDTFAIIDGTTGIELATLSLIKYFHEH